MLKDALGTTSKIATKTTTKTRSKSAADKEQAKGPSGGTRGTSKGRGSALPTNKKKAAPEAAPKAPKKRSKEVADAEKQQRKKVKKENAKKMNSRSHGFDQDEDLLLCKAFVNVSSNPVHGNDQKGSVFWAGVGSRFRDLYNQLEERVEGRARDNDACKRRFQRYIQQQTNVYNKYYKELKEKNPSGWTDKDFIEKAAEAYEEGEGQPFKWLNCIEVLHKMPKFSPMLQDLVPEGEEEENEEEAGANKIGAVMGDSLPRPMGSKKAKQKIKDDQSKVSLETTKAESMANIGNSTDNLAAAIREGIDERKAKRESDGLFKLAQLCLSQGMVEQAAEYMKKFEASISKKAERPPPSVVGPTPGVPTAAGMPSADDHSTDDQLEDPAAANRTVLDGDHITTDDVVNHIVNADANEEESTGDVSAHAV